MQENQEAQENLDEKNAPTTSAQGASGEPEQAVESVEDRIRKLEQQVAEGQDAVLRARAETENMRRRGQEEVSKAAKFAIEKFAGELLSVKDSLEQTLAVEGVTPESLREGVELTLRNLVKAFEKGAVEEVAPQGEKFDPHKHQAISAIPSDLPSNTVVQVFQKGYLLEGRVLRPALVAVSNGSAA
jgi:molecular chaperone GrpE